MRNASAIRTRQLTMLAPHEAGFWRRQGDRRRKKLQECLQNSLGKRSNLWLLRSTRSSHVQNTNPVRANEFKQRIGRVYRVDNGKRPVSKAALQLAPATYHAPMKQFIAKIWNLVARAKRVGLTLHQIHRLLANGGYPGSLNTFATYCQQVAKMTSTERSRFARS